MSGACNGKLMSEPGRIGLTTSQLGECAIQVRLTHNLGNLKYGTTQRRCSNIINHPPA